MKRQVHLKVKAAGGFFLFNMGGDSFIRAGRWPLERMYLLDAWNWRVVARIRPFKVFTGRDLSDGGEVRVPQTGGFVIEADDYTTLESVGPGVGDGFTINGKRPSVPGPDWLISINGQAGGWNGSNRFKINPYNPKDTETAGALLAGLAHSRTRKKALSQVDLNYGRGRPEVEYWQYEFSDTFISVF
ncbi:MAG: hypothetical protein ABSH56_19890 [Bryobacteraceae bacterium]